ncbi:hypothetical protein GCM10010430_79150 [Kitasatospora cystarginea]|uniref:Transposase n=1 Tax=Kitasatospora cystarginea TaxID=58350 RepID=A0ABN3F194_9ACTN
MWVAEADAAGDIDWNIAVDSTIVRAHQHAAGARADPPPALAPKGAGRGKHQDETPWQGLVARLVEVVREVGGAARDRWPRARGNSVAAGRRLDHDLPHGLLMTAT